MSGYEHSQDGFSASRATCVVFAVIVGGWGRELGPPNREIVSFRSCVRAVLVKSVRSENVPVTACIFYLVAPGGRILCLV